MQKMELRFSVKPGSRQVICILPGVGRRARAGFTKNHRIFRILAPLVLCAAINSRPAARSIYAAAGEANTGPGAANVQGAGFSTPDPKAQELIDQVASALRKARTFKASVAFRRQDVVAGKPWGDEPEFGAAEVLQFEQPNIFSFGHSYFSDGKEMGINGEELLVGPAPARLEDPLPCGNYPLQGYPGLVRARDFTDTARNNAAKLRYKGLKFAEGQQYRVLEADGPAETVRWYIGPDSLVHFISIDARMWGGTGYHDEIRVTNIVLDSPIDTAACRAGPHNTKKTFAEARQQSLPGFLPLGATAPNFKVQRVGAPYDPSRPEQVESEVELSKVIASHKATLLFFWMQRCGSCYFELPILQQLHRERAHQGVAVLAIHIDMPPGPYDNNDLLNQLQVEKRWDQWGADALSDFIHTAKYTFRMLYDPKDKVKPLFYDSKLPTVFGASVLFDQNGRAVWRGVPELGCIDSALERLGIQ